MFSSFIFIVVVVIIIIDKFSNGFFFPSVFFFLDSINSCFHYLIAIVRLCGKPVNLRDTMKAKPVLNEQRFRSFKLVGESLLKLQHLSPSRRDPQSAALTAPKNTENQVTSQE